MKRPTIALLSLLSMLTLGLVAAGPRSCHAGSLGQLAFAIQVEHTAAGDPMVYPLACCPFSEQRNRCEELLEEEAAIELNAAETVADAEQVVDNENSPQDYDYGYDYDEYGYEYSDDYDPYATDEVADEVTAEDVAAAIVDDMELNAAESNTQEELADDGYDAYYGEYADQYDYDYDYDADYNYGYEYEYDSTDYGDEYETTESHPTESVATETDGNSNSCQRVCFPIDGELQCKAMDQICDDDLVVEDTAEYSDEYYDNYYEQYYDEDFDTENVEAEAYDTDDTESAEWYEDDYEKYYSQEYYDELETAGTDEAPDVEATVVEADAPQYDAPQYDADAVYEDAVYGERFYEADFYYDVRNDCPTPPVVDEAVVAEVAGCMPEAYLAGNCIDEGNAQVMDDLPWADEVAEADVDEIDVPVAGEASEYGSDYAEEYFDDQDAELSDDALNDDVLPLDAQAAACEAHLPIAAAKTLHSKFDVSRLAAQCGSQVATWTETLAGLGQAVRIACADLESGVATR